MNKSKICTLLAGLTLAGSSVFAQAYQISPTPNFGVITVDSIGAQNNIDFTNYGAVTLSGVSTLSNYSTLANYGGFSSNALGTSTINNNGAINNRSGPVCLNSDLSILSGISADSHAASLTVGSITA